MKNLSPHHFTAKCLSLALGIGLFAFSTIRAQTNIGVGIPTGSTRNDSQLCGGWGFSAPSGGSTTVNALGFWDANGTGLQTSHMVALYKYTGSPQYTLVASVTVPAGTVAPLINGYRWVAIPTQTLPDIGQGGNYYICAATLGTDTWTTGINGTPPLDTFFGTLAGLAKTYGSDVAGNSTLSNMAGDTSADGSTADGGPNIAYFNPPLPSLDLPVIVTNIQPTSVAVPTGGSVDFSIVFSNSPAANLQWLFIANGITNNINNGVVNVTNNGNVFSTLTLTNLQVADAGSYQVKAVNATDSSMYIYSAAATLSVNGLIQWVQTGTFTDDSVLALAGDPTNEVYGVYFGGFGSQPTANGYNFDDFSAGNMTLSGGYSTYGNYLSPATLSTGDGSLDIMLTTGAYGTGTAGTLENLTVGQTYYVLVLMADTRGSAAGGSVFHSSDGVTISPGQRYAFADGSPAIGGYMLGRFTAISTEQPLDVFNNWPGVNQYNCILVAETQAGTNANAPIYLTSDTLPASATVAEDGQVSFSASFGYSPPLTFQWQSVTNGVTNTISSGIVNTTNGAIVTSTLTLSNISASAIGSYRVEAIDATNSLNFMFSDFASLSVIPTTTWVSTGVFSNDSVLTLVGPVSNVVYAVDFAGSDHQVTANGYTFDDALTTGNMSLTGHSDYNLYMSGQTSAATTGDAALDAVLTYGSYGAGCDGTLNNLTPGQTYNVLVLLDDTRGTAAGGNYFIVTDGINTSPVQQYAFSNGVPYVGGYILGNFTANSSSQPFTITTSRSGNPGNYYGPQYNAVIVAKGSPLPPTVPVLAVPYIADGNLTFTGTGGIPGGGYTLLQTTNLTPPIIWTTNLTGALDGTGSFSNSIPLDMNQSGSEFFRLRLP